MPTTISVLLGWTPAPAAAQAGATVVSQRRLVPDREVDVWLRSADTAAAVKSVRLLLPPGWAASSRSRPTLRLLHGGLDDYRSWTAHSDIARLERGAGRGAAATAFRDRRVKRRALRGSARWPGR